MECLGEKFRGECNRRVNGGRNRSKVAYATEQNLMNEGHVCLCIQCCDYEPVFMFPAAQCRLATAYSVSTTPFRPPQTHTEGHKSPPRLHMAPEWILFRSCSPFCCPVKRVSLVRDAFFWCQEFGTRLLEHKGQREGERRRKQRRELLNNFSHMLALQKRRGGGVGENSIPSTVSSRVKTDGWDDNGPGAPRTPAQSSHSSFY